MTRPSTRRKQCDQPMIEIDHYGERLTGCPRCNRWRASPGDWCPWRHCCAQGAQKPPSPKPKLKRSSCPALGKNISDPITMSALVAVALLQAARLRSCWESEQADRNGSMLVHRRSDWYEGRPAKRRCQRLHLHWQGSGAGESGY